MEDKLIRNDVELAHFASDLLDSEARQVFDIVLGIQMKYQHRANSVDNLEALRDECLTKLAQIGILATVDPAPCFYGEPPVIEIIGKVAGVQEVDHEQKQYEVLKARDRNEEYLGQKEQPNRRRAK